MAKGERLREALFLESTRRVNSATEAKTRKAAGV